MRHLAQQYRKKHPVNARDEKNATLDMEPECIVLKLSFAAVFDCG